MDRWFYLDIRACLDDGVDREDAVVIVPKDKVLPVTSNRTTELDLSTPEREYAELMFPVARVFDWDDWQDQFDRHWKDAPDTIQVFRNFKNTVLKNFTHYDVPVIALGESASKEAVCTIFEKVNTGGKPLDAFELVTAMYAASGHELRKDWYGQGSVEGRQRRLSDAYKFPDAKGGILQNVHATDFLNAVSLFHTRQKRREAEVAGKQGKELAAVSGKREAILNLPLEAYKRYEAQVEEGFRTAAKFLRVLHIYRVDDLPYQTQIIPLAAILAEIGKAWENEAVRRKLFRWYWCGVFGELYGSAVDTRIAKDFLEVPAWVLRDDGPVPTTITDTTFRAARLATMRMRLSAAYKGVNALLMNAGAEDFRSGQDFEQTVYFDEDVDIHHIFPQKWCKANGKNKAEYDSIINKTPLSKRTNIIIGGNAPSQYLAKLEAGGDDYPAVESAPLDAHLVSHLIDPGLLRADSFEAFMRDRQAKLLQLIESAIGAKAAGGPVSEEDEEGEEGLGDEAMSEPAVAA